MCNRIEHWIHWVAPVFFFANDFDANTGISFTFNGQIERAQCTKEKIKWKRKNLGRFWHFGREHGLYIWLLGFFIVNTAAHVGRQFPILFSPVLHSTYATSQPCFYAIGFTRMNFPRFMHIL